MSPRLSRYSVTTREPGASDVFTHCRVSIPASTARFARSPAAIITDGFEVFVHDVIAAITTDPCRTSRSSGVVSSLQVFSSSLPFGGPALRHEATKLGRLRFGLEVAAERVDERVPARKAPGPAAARDRPSTARSRRDRGECLRERRRVVVVGAEQPLRLHV